MDALRTELRGYFWDGEFRDTQGARVASDGKPHLPYAVFIHAQNGRPGLVVCNYQEDTPVTVSARMENGYQLTRWRSVDDPTWMPVEGGIRIEAQSAVVVV